MKIRRIEYHKSLLVIMIMLYGLNMFGQSNVNQRFTLEGMEFAAGLSSMLGDLGGANQIGSHGVRDFDIEAVRYSSQTGLIFKLNNKMNLRTGIEYTLLHGSDKYTLNHDRRERNITVTTHLIGFNPKLEYTFKIKSHANRRLGNIVSVYGGAGIIFFQPYGEFDNKKYALHPLGTEGQLLTGDKKSYSRVVMNIPYGLSVGKNISKKYSVLIDFNGNFTFTDYLDDVSSLYFDNEQIKNSGGEAAAFFADPKLSEIKSMTGEQRGNSKDRDNYLTISFRLKYNFTSQNKLF